MAESPHPTDSTQAMSGMAAAAASAAMAGLHALATPAEQMASSTSSPRATSPAPGRSRTDTGELPAEPSSQSPDMLEGGAPVNGASTMPPPLRRWPEYSEIHVAYPLPENTYGMFARTTELARLILPLMLEHLRGRLEHDAHPHHVGLSPNEARELLWEDASQCLRIQRACGHHSSPPEEDVDLLNQLFSEAYFGEQPLTLNITADTIRHRVLPAVIQTLYERGEPSFTNYAYKTGQHSMPLADVRSLFDPAEWRALLDAADAVSVVRDFVEARPALKLDPALALTVLYAHEDAPPLDPDNVPTVDAHRAAPSIATAAPAAPTKTTAAQHADVVATKRPDTESDNSCSADAGLAAVPALANPLPTSEAQEQDSQHICHNYAAQTLADDASTALGPALSASPVSEASQESAVYERRKLRPQARLAWLLPQEMTWLCQAAFDAVDEVDENTTMIVFGNTPYIVGSLLKRVAKARGKPIPEVIFLPFSGAPDHRREHKATDWRSATSPARIAFLNKVLTKHGATLEALRGRNVKLLDLVGSGGGPFFFLLELMHQNSGKPFCHFEMLCLNVMPARFTDGWLSNVRLVGPDVSLQHTQHNRRGIMSHPNQDAPLVHVPFRSIGMPTPLLLKLDETMGCQRFQPFFYALYWQDCYASNVEQTPSLMAEVALRDIAVHCEEWLKQKNLQ